MPSWSEAWDDFIKQRDEAMERKEIRDGREEELRSFFQDLSTEEWQCLAGIDKPAERI